MSDWMKDEREIISLKLPFENYPFDTRVGDRFERIEHNGEYCMIPWVRILTSKGAVVEAPLNHVDSIEYRP